MFLVAILGLAYWFFQAYPKTAEVLPVSYSQAQIATPVRIKIPTINVDAAIEAVGTAPDGSMGVPLKPVDAGWYMTGTRPGEVGSAVIDGHVDWTNGARAVFSDLHQLQSGDRVVVENDDGTTTAFLVRTSKIYSPTADATDIFGSTDGQAHLNLITCQGVWDKSTQGYSERLVVFTDKE